MEIDAKYAGTEFGTLVHRFFEVGDAPESIKIRLAEAARKEGLPADLIETLGARVDSSENG